MKFVRAAIYPILFVAAFVAGSIAVGGSGIGVYITRLTITPRTTFSQAYSTLNSVNGALTLGFAILVVVAVWSIRHPGGLRAKFEGMLRQARNASGRALVAYWVVAVLTIVGYALAIYATWHYAKRRPARSAPAASTDDLASRLARIDSARDAGLITPQEHADKRANLIQSW